MDEKINFSQQAISDTKDIIKSMDFKIAALLTANLVPISKLGSIYDNLRFLMAHENAFISIPSILASFLFLLFWGLALYTITKSIAALDNPSSHIVNSKKYSGIYYSGGLYKFNLIDTFFNRSEIRAERDVDHHVKKYPNSKEEILDELCFEQLKLCYIRDIKIHRFNQSVKISYAWAAIGVFLFVFSKSLQ